MEHILQFAVSIDDTAIEKLVIEGATKQLANEIIDKAKKSIGLADRYGRIILDEDGEGYFIVKEAIEKAVKEREDEIIDRVIDRIVEKTYRGKKYQKMLDNFVDKSNED